MRSDSQSVTGPKLLEQARDVVAALPAARAALDAGHRQLAESADRSVAEHPGSLAESGRLPWWLRVAP
jgi:hypothetical protein